MAVSVDRVNHDRLMAKIAERVSDKSLLKLIRAFLQAGVMEGELVNPPLLSNIVLNGFDRELRIAPKAVDPFNQCLLRRALGFQH